MPKATLAMLILIVWAQFFLSGCNHEKKEVLASKIQYDVPIINNDPQLDWWINNLEGSKREPFLKRMMEAVEKGEVKACDYFGNPITPAQVRGSLSDTVYQTLMRSTPPYEEYDTMVILTINYRDISKLRFLEEWSWDASTMRMEKKLIGFGPVIQRKTAGETYNQLLFWIMF